MERIQLRRDLSTTWADVNPILMEGEVGFEIDTKLRKIGDGVTAWNNLDYLAAENIVQELGDSENAVVSQKGISEIIHQQLGEDVTLHLDMYYRDNVFTTDLVKINPTNSITIIIKKVTFVSTNNTITLTLTDSSDIIHYETIPLKTNVENIFNPGYTIKAIRLYKGSSTITSAGDIEIEYLTNYKSDIKYDIDSKISEINSTITTIENSIGQDIDYLVQLKESNGIIISDNIYIRTNKFYFKLNELNAQYSGNFYLNIFFMDGTNISPFPEIKGVGYETIFEFDKEVNFIRLHKGASVVTSYKDASITIKTGLYLSGIFISESSTVTPLFNNDLIKDPFGICYHFTRDSEDLYITNAINKLEELKPSFIRSGIYLANYITGQPILESTLAKLIDKVTTMKNAGIEYVCTIAGFVEIANNNNRDIVNSDITVESLENYKNAITTFVTALNSCGVIFYEVENELDLKLKIPSVSIENCRLIYSTAKLAIKEANPNAKILCSFSSIINTITSSIPDIFEYFDIFNYHIYPTINNALIHKSEGSQISTLIKKWKQEKEVWITETGASTYNSNNVESYSETEKANIIAMVLLSSLCYGINKIFVYSLREVGNTLHEKNFGICNEDITIEKESFKVYKNIIDLVKYGTNFEIKEEADTTKIHYTNKNNIKCSILFSKIDNYAINVSDHNRVINSIGEYISNNVVLNKWEFVFVIGESLY